MSPEEDSSWAARGAPTGGVAWFRAACGASLQPAEGRRHELTGTGGLGVPTQQNRHGAQQDRQDEMGRCTAMWQRRAKNKQGAGPPKRAVLPGQRRVFF